VTRDGRSGVTYEARKGAASAKWIVTGDAELTSSSFTIKSDGGPILDLNTPCRVTAAFDLAVHPHPEPVEFTACWDTGTAITRITERVVDACGLKPAGLTNVWGTTSNDMFEVPEYLVGIQLLNNVVFPMLRAPLCFIRSGCDVLIGLDIITRGDFVITNKGGTTIFSFCYPSVRQTDYVAEHKANLSMLQFYSSGSSRPKKHKQFWKREKA
jgi:hypothetical protein